MWASLDWIESYLSGDPCSPEQAAKLLTMSGSEVEEIVPKDGDHLLSVGVTSNRPDCLCHLGLAREIAALTGRDLKNPSADFVAEGPATADAIQVSIEDSSRCGRYVAHVIEGVRIGPSPDWLRRRLEAIGLRSINNVVDVTNFVLHERNQPLHAFDLDRLTGSSILVRAARAGESMTLLDGRQIALTGADLVIADASHPVALAGVMGGRDSEVCAQTTRILLESAWFEPGAVRQAARRHGISTDSSYRFERRVDRQGAAEAAARAVQLILAVAGGKARSAPLDLGAAPPAIASIPLRFSRIAEVTAVSVPSERVQSILRSLSCEIQAVDALGLEVRPPSFRADLAREIDLIEEVIRVHGLDQVPESGGMAVRVVARNPGRELREGLSDQLAGLGFHEAITPDFVSLGDAQSIAYVLHSEPLVVKNPVRKDEPALRRSLLPSLLKVRQHNQDHGFARSYVFESARVVAAPTGKGQGPQSKVVLGILSDDEPRTLRGVLEALLKPRVPALKLDAAELPGLSAGARWLSGEVVVGVFGLVANSGSDRFGKMVTASYAEIDLDALLPLVSPERKFRALPRFPAVERDLAVILPQTTTWASIESTIFDLRRPNLERLDLFDLYRGKGIIDGHQSVGIRMTFRSLERTLTSEDVDADIEHIAAALEGPLGGRIRRG